jgi:CspA family cold shock protein
MKYIGTVKWYSTTKGYGFITPKEDSKKDVFVHSSALANSGINELYENQEVEYSLVERHGKISANDISILSK